MAVNNPAWRYERAMQKLSKLVLKRDDLLRDLQQMCLAALSTSAALESVVAFDIQQARAVLKRIGRHNSQIARAMTRANEYAAQSGQPLVQWKRSEPPTGAGSQADVPSAA